MKAIERIIEFVIFNSRWLMAPFYLGLVIALLRRPVSLPSTSK